MLVHADANAGLKHLSGYPSKADNHVPVFPFFASRLEPWAMPGFQWPPQAQITRSPEVSSATARKQLQEQGIEPLEDWTHTVTLPKGSEGWTQFEQDLYLQSDGVYHPQEMESLRRHVPGFVVRSGTGFKSEMRKRVSIVTPTISSRQHYHEQLWECFQAQDWPDKELVVVETYQTSPSAFLTEKAKECEQFVYVAIKRDLDEDFTVGLKRDMTLHLASGEYIVNFDDDDIYAASYVSTMVREMQEKNLDALTLSAWHNFYCRTGACGYSDSDCWDAMDQEELDEVLYGYGFSYVYKRSVALLFPYPNADFAEDAPFLLKLRDVFGKDRVALKKDDAGVCMHIMHQSNTTDDCNFSRQLSESEVLDLKVATLPAFQNYLDQQSRSLWFPWLRLWTPAELTIECRDKMAC